MQLHIISNKYVVKWCSKSPKWDIKTKPCYRFPISAGWSNPYQYWLILAIGYIILFLSLYCVTLCVKHYKTHCLLLKSNCLLLMSIWSLMFIGEKHQCFHIFLLGHPASHPNFGRSSSCSIVKLSHFHDFHGWEKISSCFTSHFQHVFFLHRPHFSKGWTPLTSLGCAASPAGPRSRSPRRRILGPVPATSPPASAVIADEIDVFYQNILLGGSSHLVSGLVHPSFLSGLTLLIPCKSLGL